MKDEEPRYCYTFEDLLDYRAYAKFSLIVKLQVLGLNFLNMTLKIISLLSYYFLFPISLTSIYNSKKLTVQKK